MTSVALPDLAAIVDPLLGRPYAEYDCWRLVRHLFEAGWGIALDDDPALAIQQVEEIWCIGDDADPLTLVHPWDVLVFRTRGMASSHVGIMVNEAQFVHTRQRNGVCLEWLQRWRPRLLQLARLRRLM